MHFIVVQTISLLGACSMELPCRSLQERLSFPLAGVTFHVTGPQRHCLFVHCVPWKHPRFGVGLNWRCFVLASYTFKIHTRSYVFYAKVFFSVRSCVRKSRKTIPFIQIRRQQKRQFHPCFLPGFLLIGVFFILFEEAESPFIRLKYSHEDGLIQFTTSPITVIDVVAYLL